MTPLEEFSKNLEGQDISQLIREAKVESERRMLGQGIASLALFLSEVMVRAMTTSDLEDLRHWLTPLMEPQSTVSQP